MSTLEVSNLNDGTTTVATTYITNGSAKAWVAHSSTPSINGSYNVASLTDNGTGNFDINLSNAMANANYSIPSSCDVAARISSTSDVSASEFNIVYYNLSGSLEDRGGSAEVLGDLA
tara:strand:+ start:1759 stop:2109 length:351 start_codon:yes stop_codon:yes gene_type:complete